jgi:ribose/xylose/arabinose/galactoside ABC-type transport system permease subunit
MNHSLKLDFFAYCWILLFLVPALICSFLGMIIVGGNISAVILTLVALFIAIGVLVFLLSEWQWWLSRMLLTASVAGCWYLLLGSIWSHYKDFC